MAIQHRGVRRARYHGRRHDVDTRPVPTAVPTEISWKRLPGGPVGHAFSSGPGWARSVCRSERWNVLVEDLEPTDAKCPECLALVAGEIPESELRVMDGNR